MKKTLKRSGLTAGFSVLLLFLLMLSSCAGNAIPKGRKSDQGVSFQPFKMSVKESYIEADWNAEITIKADITGGDGSPIPVTWYVDNILMQEGDSTEFTLRERPQDMVWRTVRVEAVQGRRRKVDFITVGIHGLIDQSFLMYYPGMPLDLSLNAEGITGETPVRWMLDGEPLAENVSSVSLKDQLTGSHLVEVEIEHSEGLYRDAAAIQPPGKAKNIILLIGDGMGATQRQAAAWSEAGIGEVLLMDIMPVRGLSRTKPIGDSITDSAAGGTALSTGHKTQNGKIAMGPDGENLETILELARNAGKATGLVTTVQIPHATPAVFAAHHDTRDDLEEIFRKMINSDVNVLMGGGERYMQPSSVEGNWPGKGTRKDNLDLIEYARNLGYAYVWDQESFFNTDWGSEEKVLGVFSDDGLIRPYAPSLDEMVEKTLHVLHNDPDGFFLMVEGGQIDWSGHDNEAEFNIQDTRDFNKAVHMALDYASDVGNTLVIVAADHETGGMYLTQEPLNERNEDGPFLSPMEEQFYVNWTSTDHTAADVPVTAAGPWSGFLGGRYQNTHIFWVMKSALYNEYLVPGKDSSGDDTAPESGSSDPETEKTYTGD